jgi:hypothetical protein
MFNIIVICLNTCLSYRHVLGVCVTYKTGFGFDDRICWTFIQLVTTFHNSLSSTGHTSDHTTLIHYFTTTAARVLLCKGSSNLCKLIGYVFQVPRYKTLGSFKNLGQCF